MSESAIREEGLFLQVDGERVFAFLHQPERAALLSVVMVHACAEEKLWSHRVYVNFARALAADGIAVLRIDCRGEGESDLAFEQSTLSTRLSDVRAAIDFMKARGPEGGRIILLGHRLGSMVAALAASAADVRPDGLILWDPVYDGRTYLLQVLRQHLSAQLAASGRVTVTRDQLLQKMMQGERVSIEGYAFNREFCSGLCAASWVDNPAVFDVPVLLAEVAPTDSAPLSGTASKLAAAFPSVTATLVREPPFWRETREFAQSAPRLAQATFEWLSGFGK